jgi:hypothetical protein
MVVRILITYLWKSVKIPAYCFFFSRLLRIDMLLRRNLSSILFNLSISIPLKSLDISKVNFSFKSETSSCSFWVFLVKKLARTYKKPDKNNIPIASLISKNMRITIENRDIPTLIIKFKKL